MYFLLFILEDPDEELDIRDSAHELLISAILAVSKIAGLLGKDADDINVCWDFSKLSEDFFGLAGVKLIDGGNAGTIVVFVVAVVIFAVAGAFFKRLVVAKFWFDEFFVVPEEVGFGEFFVVVIWGFNRDVEDNFKAAGFGLSKVLFKRLTDETEKKTTWNQYIIKKKL